MHKKLASELTSIAHSILQMKNKEDVVALKEKAFELYEKLSVLAYVEEYINNTPQATETKEDLLAKIAEVEEIQKLKLELEAKQKEAENNPTLIALSSESTLEEATETPEEEPEIIGELDEDEVQMDDFADDIAEDVIEKIEEDSITETIVEELIQKPIEEIAEQPFDELEELLSGGGDDNKKFDEASFIEELKAPTLEDELKDTISVDVTADLFTKAEPQKKSLNDRLQNTIQIGLNDRIAFVKHLFNGDSGDFNRVVSQLNTFDTEKDAKKFINKTVKPDYDWSDKEEYETRFLEIVERRFS